MAAKPILADLPLHMATVDADTPGEDVDKLLRADPDLPGVIVKDKNGSIAGVVERTAFLDKLSHRFGHALYLHRPIRTLMVHLEPRPTIVAAGVTIDEAAHIVLSRPPSERELPLVVTLPDGQQALVHAEAVLHAMCRLLEATLADLKRREDDLVEARKLAALGDIVAGIAHEINTPIGNGITCASHLAETAADVSAKLDAGSLKRSELVGFLDTVGEEAKLVQGNLMRAADLIRSFKQVAADERSEARRGFLLKAYLQDIVFNLRPRLRHTPHQITIDCPPDLALDSYPGAVSQIVINLIINALEHAFTTGAPGHILISARALDGDIEIRLSDDGKGIPPEDVPRIFERFFTRSGHAGGTGLGLFIVETLVRGKLEGQIRCESHVGEGTTFIIIIPRAVVAGPVS
ncbi:MAG: HAMP domain-containing histidine kinase [Rhodospirillales bacterium]|jgi:signal transduction histidine kinase|nr:HAMP domain-containing histidine kinase [Rhodospirillales bacterium]